MGNIHIGKYSVLYLRISELIFWAELWVSCTITKGTVEEYYGTIFVSPEWTQFINR